MRNTLMMSVAVLGLVSGSAFAQSGSGQTPPSPNAASQMPQPANSAPAGAESRPMPAAGSKLGGSASQVPMAEAPTTTGHKPMRHMATGHMRHMDKPAEAQDAAVGDQSAPPTSAYRGGVGSPSSTRATDLTPSRGEKIGSRLPTPVAAGNSPRELLAAAQTALTKGQTGAAQQALEMAETRALTRTTDPSEASQPDQQAMVLKIAQARQALGARNTNGAKEAIAAALDERTPPRGPATTTSPAGQPSGGTF